MLQKASSSSPGLYRPSFPLGVVIFAKISSFKVRFASWSRKCSAVDLQYLELTGVNPSAVHVSSHHGHKGRANHGSQRGDNRSAVAEPHGTCQKPAYYSATNTHKDVHKRTIAIALKNSAGSPANDCPNAYPCK